MKTKLQSKFHAKKRKNSIVYTNATSLTSIRPSGLNQSPFMEIEDITSIEDVSIEFEENTTSNGKKTLIENAKRVAQNHHQTRN